MTMMMMWLCVQTVDEAKKYAQRNNRAFPDITDKDRDLLKSFNVYPEKDTPTEIHLPTVIHIPLFNTENCGGMDDFPFIYPLPPQLFHIDCIYLIAISFESVFFSLSCLWFLFLHLYTFNAHLFSCPQWHTDEFTIEQERDAYTTFQMTYRDREKINQLADLAAKNVKLNREDILKQIRRAAERRMAKCWWMLVIFLWWEFNYQFYCALTNVLIRHQLHFFSWLEHTHILSLKTHR